MRVKQIDSIKFQFGGLYWAEYNNSRMIISTEITTLKGNRVVFEDEIKYKNITLESKNNGWITKEEKEQLINLANNSLGKTYEIVLEDNTVKTVRFRHIPNAVITDRLNSVDTLYIGTIYLSEV
jgi:hypothetical protein